MKKTLKPKTLKRGIHNIYKPAGPTSHDLVDQARRISGEKRVGHAGTLDPFAEGVLIVAIGREYTKKLGGISKQNKTYRAVIKLGAVSDTRDRTGKITPTPKTSHPSIRKLGKVLKRFTGEISQIPPAFSAIKIKGRPAYQLARRGITVNLAPRLIKIYSLTVLKYRWPRLEIETTVSSGTYIRSLAQDLGQALGIGGYLEKLIRTKVGRYSIKNSRKI